MKKLYGSFAAKLIAVILLCLLVLAFVGSAIAAGNIYSWGGYSGSQEEVRKTVYRNTGTQGLNSVGRAYVEGRHILGFTVPEKDSFWYEIYDNEGNLLESNYDGGKTLWEGEMCFGPEYSLEISGEEPEAFEEVTPTPDPTAPATAARPTPAPVQIWKLTNMRDNKLHTFTSENDYLQWVDDNSVTVRGYLPDPMPSYYAASRELAMAESLYAYRYTFLWILGLSFLLGVLVFIFLLCAAGHRKDTEEIVPSFVEKIPFDLFTLLIIGLIAICLTPINGGWDWPEVLVILIPMILCIGLLFLLWCVSFAVRVKLGRLWSETICCKLFRLLGKGLRALPLVWKWAVVLAVLAVLDLLLRESAIYSENRTAFHWFCSWLVLGGATLYAVLAFRRLREGTKEIADGNLSCTVDDKYLVAELKDHAQDLNHIRDGLNNAVEERMKSERFRTELITNVSHDIKTPLTSIVNYVDLLQKEEPENEKQREYLEVLSRQSGKLKKLIEDLIEAFKASTGNLAVDLEPCELGVLLDQTSGEYGEKLESAGLELVLQKPEKPVRVMADGRHLWRVFDNLLNNIVKYAQPGTRVYLSLSEENGKARVDFRNISREQLNISAQELTERFVRGDASRNTEGSGLGLAIAMSLMRLQKGNMDITVDGDLFKVSLSFDTIR